MQEARAPGGQAPDGKAQEPGGDAGAAAGRNPSVLAYEARRCRVCDARHPAFGFGPPLTRKGQDVWACGPHRAEVERLVRSGADVATKEQPSLLWKPAGQG